MSSQTHSSLRSCRCSDAAVCCQEGKVPEGLPNLVSVSLCCPCMVTTFSPVPETWVFTHRYKYRDALPEHVGADALQPKLAVRAGHILIHDEPLVRLGEGVRHCDVSLRNACHLLSKWRGLLIMRSKGVPHNGQSVCCSHVCKYNIPP